MCTVYLGCGGSNGGLRWRLRARHSLSRQEYNQATLFGILILPCIQFFLRQARVHCGEILSLHGLEGGNPFLNTHGQGTAAC